MITVSAVANATRGQLLCITYELLLENIRLAQQSEDTEKALYLNKAIRVLRMLIKDLDFNYQIAHELFRLYVYVQGLLIKGKALDEACSIINKLKTAYEEISKEDQSMQSMNNVEMLYAGLTYGKSSLNETSFGRENRGFKA